jgi:hypothetical protein
MVSLAASPLSSPETERTETLDAPETERTDTLDAPQKAA